jgi:hypothetical protein
MESLLHDRMVSLAIVPLAVWVGVFAYLLGVERKVARVEAVLRERRR